jgi:hypothetical protein
MNIGPIKSLAAAWREEAARLERRGLEREARIVENFASDLEQRLREWELQELTLEQAATELGLKYDTVQRRVACGELPNAGHKGAPLVRRCDLYGGASSTPRLVTEGGEPDIAAEVLLAGGG